MFLFVALGFDFWGIIPYSHMVFKYLAITIEKIR